MDGGAVFLREDLREGGREGGREGLECETSVSRILLSSKPSLFQVCRFLRRSVSFPPSLPPSLPLSLPPSLPPSFTLVLRMSRIGIVSLVEASLLLLLLLLLLDKEEGTTFARA